MTPVALSLADTLAWSFQEEEGGSIGHGAPKKGQDPGRCPAGERPP